MVALGLALGGCGSDDDPESETINSAAAYGVEETSINETVSATGTGTSSSGSSESSGSSSESSSGSSGGATDTDTDTDTETDTDTGGTTLEPDYGVPTTSG